MMTGRDDRARIAPEAWERRRWAWLAGVRGDAGLSQAARLVAHILVLDFCNLKTMQCDPTYRQIAERLHASPPTAKRAVADLVASGRLARTPGRHRGARSRYAFLELADVVPLRRENTPSGGGERGSTMTPFEGERGSPMTPFGGSERGSPMTPFGEERGSPMNGKGVMGDPPHNIDKPWKNHGARAGAGPRTGAHADPRAGARAGAREAGFTEAQRRTAALIAPKIAGGAYVPPSIVTDAVVACLRAIHGITPDQIAAAGFQDLLRKGGKGHEQ